jgi:hypothetical protein
MQVPTVVLALSFAAAGVAGCSRSETDVAPTTTTAPRTATTTTTLMPADVPESATAPGEVFPRRRQRFGDERPPREPRMPRQAIRNHLAEVLAARRPDRPLSPGELEQLTNRAMQIRILRSRLAHMRPEAQQTPRAAAMRGRLGALIDDFQTRAGVLITDVPAIFEPPAPRPRRGM